MKENVRGVIEIAQLLLRNKTGKRNAVVDLEFARQVLKLTEQWPFSRDGQRCVWITLQKTRESTQRNRQALFLDQPASLHESPFAILPKAPFAKRKFIKWNPSVLDFDLSFVATKIDNSASQRFRADQNKLHRGEHLPRGFSIRRLVHFHDHVRAVKGNNRRFFPCAN